MALSVLLAIDLYLHHKHGINLWGYRGAAVGKKQAGEKRVAVLGGSTTWGFGLAAGQDFPGQLQTRFSQGAAGPKINVLNLGFNNDGAYSFKYTLKDYAYLDYDEVVIYSGYNDLIGSNQIVFRHRSPIFIWTGYLPLLPALTVDKLKVWKNRMTKGDKPIVFAPPGPKESSAQTSRSLEEEIGRLSNSRPPDTNQSEDCPTEWQFYCQEIYEAIDSELKSGKRVLIVTEPYISDQHVQQQRALAGMLNRRFAGQTNLRYINLGRTVDLRDPALCWDGMHLTEAGNRKIAESLAQPILEMLRF
ncbi:MAG: SGNH/GDSL hydrolase family protein [Acidobacteriota bacterium]